MRIQHNISAMNTQRQLGTNNTATSKSLEKLSSGYRVNRAGDDAAGLAISEKMRAQIRGLNRASENAQDGVSLIQAAEGALQETHSILQRMRELAVQAANDVNETEDRKAIQDEINQLVKEVDRIANTTEFNKKTLLDGSLQNGLYAKIGTGVGVEAATVTDKTLSGVYDIEVSTLAEYSKGTSTIVATSTAALEETDYIKVSFADMGDGATPLIITADEISGLDDAGISEYVANKVVSHINNKESNIDLYEAKLVGSNILEFQAKTPGAPTAQGAITYTVVSGTNSATDLDLSSGDATAAGGVDVAFTVSGTDFNGTALTVATPAAADYNSKTGYLTITDGTDAILTLKMTDVTKATAQTVTVKNGSDLTLQVGANTGETQTIAIAVADLSAVGLGLSALDVSSHRSSQTAVNSIESALQKVSDQRAALGAVQNRLEHVSANLDTVSENLQSAEARIRDTDMAKEMMEFSKNNILMQAAQAMLAQANALPQGVLQLLR